MNLNDAEQFNNLIVKPAVDAIKAELGPLVTRLDLLESTQTNIDGRVQKLESVASKVLTIYSGLVAVLTFAAHYAWSKFKSKIGA